MSHGHDEHHDAHAGGHAAPEPPAAPPPHVFQIARFTQWLGILLWVLGALGALLLLFSDSWARIAVAAFLSLYGFCVWLAARDTLAQEPMR